MEKKISPAQINSKFKIQWDTFMMLALEKPVVV